IHLCRSYVGEQRHRPRWIAPGPPSSQSIRRRRREHFPTAPAPAALLRPHVFLPDTQESPPRSANDRIPSLANDGMKIGRVIRAAHERTGGDMFESFFAGNLAEEFELGGRDVLNYRQMLRSGAKILAHGKNLHTYLAQIIHRLK